MIEYRELVRRSVLEDEGFVKAVFSGRRPGAHPPWRRVLLRPVLIKGKRHLQVSHLDEKQDITKNFLGDEAVAKLEELLALPYRNIVLHTTEGAIQIEISKKGKAFLRHHAGPKIIAPNLAHDRKKALLLPAGTPDPFLEAIGIMTPEGRVRARMQKKFSQINKFLELIVDTADLEAIDRCPLQIVDCGCGNAYLTFAIYYYLNSVLKIPALMTGIDVNAGLLHQRSEAAQRLGWDGMRFETTKIADFRPNFHPTIVVALHACDTATDEALAGAVQWGSELIFAAPCCHHHLQAQMTRQRIPRPYGEILRSGIMKERMGDLLTDGLRALLLRMHGYRADIVQFVSTQHTPKNLMIRAVKSERVAAERAELEYRELTDLWRVRPYLAELLDDGLV